MLFKHSFVATNNCIQRHFSVVNSPKYIIIWAKRADSLSSFFQLIKWAELASSIWRAELSRAEWAGSIWRAELSWAFSEIEFGELSWAEPKSSAQLSASYEPSYSSFHLYILQFAEKIVKLAQILYQINFTEKTCTLESINQSISRKKVCLRLIWLILHTM